MSIRITDQKHGTRGSHYHFVMGGTTATPVRMMGRLIKENGKETTYEIEETQVRGKKILRASFSNSGGLYLSEIDPKDFTGENYPSGKKLEISDITRLKIYTDAETEQLVNLFRKDYGKIIDDIKNIQRRVGFKLDATHASQTESLLEDPNKYVQRCLCMPQKRQRKLSLQQMMKFSHQIWCIAKIMEALDARKSDGWNISRKQSNKHSLDDPSALYEEYKKKFSKDPPYDFQREKAARFWQRTTLGRPTCVFGNKSGSFSSWLEFQIPTLEGKIIRPDIVVQKGKHESLFDPAILDEISSKEWNFFHHLQQIDLVVECKEFPFIIWSKEIDKQIIPYRKAINPKKMILVSKEKIPPDVKQKLADQKIITLDGASPDNTGFLNNLKSEISFLEEN